jgi:hypothetical protein
MPCAADRSRSRRGGRARRSAARRPTIVRPARFTAPAATSSHNSRSDADPTVTIVPLCDSRRAASRVRVRPHRCTGREEPEPTAMRVFPESRRASSSASTHSSSAGATERIGRGSARRMPRGASGAAFRSDICRSSGSGHAVRQEEPRTKADAPRCPGEQGNEERRSHGARRKMVKVEGRDRFAEKALLEPDGVE